MSATIGNKSTVRCVDKLIVLYPCLYTEVLRGKKKKNWWQRQFFLTVLWVAAHFSTGSSRPGSCVAALLAGHLAGRCLVLAVGTELAGPLVLLHVASNPQVAWTSFHMWWSRGHIQDDEDTATRCPEARVLDQPWRPFLMSCQISHVPEPARIGRWIHGPCLIT